MSKTVLQPRSPRAYIFIAARAVATSMLAVNWGLESRVSLYSMVWCHSLSQPVMPLRITLPPWGRPLWFFCSSSAVTNSTVVS